jgi:membrane fusion protein (multidrug efflux system)
LPPENAVGNYIKVVQRVPVKIVFDEALSTDLDIAPGMSVVPTVKVK